MSFPQLPLLPLILDRVPTGLIAALAQEGVPYRAWSLGAPQGRFLLHDRRQGPSRCVDYRQIPIDVDRFRPAFSEDPFLALEDEQIEVHQWSFGRAKMMHSRGRVDRRAYRRKLLGLLRTEIEAAGGIWLHLAPYPFPYRTALNVRLDHLHYEPQAFEAALQALAGNESATSHFLQITNFYSHPEALSQLRNFDLGILGGLGPEKETVPFYRKHKPRLPPFPAPEPSPSHIAKNLRQDLELMHRVGLTPEGFLPPGGSFQPVLPPLLLRIEFPHVVLDDLGADDLPFFPPSSSVLHVPSHPIGVQTLLAAEEDSGFRVQGSGDRGEGQEARDECSRTETGVSERGNSQALISNPQSLIPNPQSLITDPSPLTPHPSFASAYFAHILLQKYRAGEPMFFQGHVPGGWGEHPAVLRQLFDQVREHAAVWKTTLSRFARWWRSRAEVQLTVVAHDDFYTLAADYLPHQYRLGVEFHRGRHVARMEINRRVLRFSPAALAYENCSLEPAFQPVRLDGPHALSRSVPLHAREEKSALARERVVRRWKKWISKAAQIWNR